MTATRLQNGSQIELKLLTSHDWDKLSDYLNALSPESKRRFGPHGYDSNSIKNMFDNPGYTGYLAIDPGEDSIIGYAIVKIGCLEHDRERLESYGLTLDDFTVATLAPSVADQWQGKGLSDALLRFILSELRPKGINRILLWGGVQATNYRARGFYQKHNFRPLGSFHYHGENIDMSLDM